MKMESVLMYVAEDGTQFENQWICENYERGCKLNEIYSTIPTNNFPLPVGVQSVVVLKPETMEQLNAINDKISCIYDYYNNEPFDILELELGKWYIFITTETDLMGIEFYELYVFSPDYLTEQLKGLQ
jgi:hypothetical protein